MDHFNLIHVLILLNVISTPICVIRISYSVCVILQVFFNQLSLLIQQIPNLLNVKEKILRVSALFPCTSLSSMFNIFLIFWLLKSATITFFQLFDDDLLIMSLCLGLSSRFQGSLSVLRFIYQDMFNAWLRLMNIVSSFPLFLCKYARFE